MMCTGPIHAAPLYLGYSFRTDLLLLRLTLRAPLAYSAHDPWLHDGLRTLAEALALSASRKLDIDPGELSAGYRLMPPAHIDSRALAHLDIYLYDTASGGAGYAAEAGETLPAVLAQTRRLLTQCVAGCDRSCAKCLRHYGNRFWHERLDRHLAAQLLAYGMEETLPAISGIEEQAKQLSPLGRYLELEGWDVRSRFRIGGVEAPLVIQHKGTSTAVGCHPALLSPIHSRTHHVLGSLESTGAARVVLLNDYVVSRDLPTAYNELLKWLGS